MFASFPKAEMQTKFSFGGDLAVGFVTFREVWAAISQTCVEKNPLKNACSYLPFGHLPGITRTPSSEGSSLTFSLLPRSSFRTFLEWLYFLVRRVGFQIAFDLSGFSPFSSSQI